MSDDTPGSDKTERREPDPATHDSGTEEIIELSAQARQAGQTASAGQTSQVGGMVQAERGPQAAGFVKPGPAPRGATAPADLSFSSMLTGKADAGLRELLCLVVAVSAADVLIYSGGGYAGWGILLLVWTVLVWCGSTSGKGSASAWWAFGVAFLAGLRLLWLGNRGVACLGVAGVAAFSCALAGYRPFPAVICVWILASISSGIVNLCGMARQLTRRVWFLRISVSSAIWIPLAALSVFGFIFVMANPVLRDWCADRIGDFVRWLQTCPISFGRICFWGFIAVLFSGAVRLRLVREFFAFDESLRETSSAGNTESTPLGFSAARNTLAALIALFTAYLVFEFMYLWLRPIPKGFQYSSYAHVGAAWLTFALAVATFTLGVIFHGPLAHHPRVRLLERLTWTWSVQSFLLAIAVFHRTQIYVVYNGMSRMRVVALFGIGVVVVGYVLVIMMVRHRRNLLWLVRRQIWALAVTLGLLAVTPVDWFVTRYNVRRIMAGDLPPSVQIAVHPIDESGIGELLPLVSCPDVQIREGVKAMLARGEEEARTTMWAARNKSWTDYQIAAALAEMTLSSHASQWQDYRDRRKRQAAIEAFQAATRKWYD